MIVFVHGGVSGRADPADEGRLDLAVRAGLEQASVMDAVEAATRVLEDDPLLNAGTGAVLDRAGNVSLDAGICVGSTRRCGAVASVRVKNPVSLARRVMETTPHVLLVGAGADALGADMPRVAITPEARQRWERAKVAGRLTDDSFGRPETVDTVGTIALDPGGALVAASSTGGVFGKLPGRVGDAAIPGAGFFASERAASVGTGVGELFIEHLASFRVVALIEDGAEPQDACRDVIAAIGATDSRPIGLLAVDKDGRVGAAFNGARWQIEGPEGPYEAELLSAG